MTLTLRTALPADRDAVIDLINALNRHEAGLAGDRRRDRSGAVAYHGELLQRLARRSGRRPGRGGGRIVAAMGFCIDEDAAYVTDRRRPPRHGDGPRGGRGAPRPRHRAPVFAEAERLTREAGARRPTIGALVASGPAERTYWAFGFEPYVSILVKEL